MMRNYLGIQIMLRILLGHQEIRLMDLMKLLVQLECAASVPNAQLRRMNPHVRSTLRVDVCAMPTQAGTMETAGDVEAGGMEGGTSGSG